MKTYRESFALLDIALKLYGSLDKENFGKYKTLSLLGALLYFQGNVSF